MSCLLAICSESARYMTECAAREGEGWGISELPENSRALKKSPPSGKPVRRSG